jgi:hypothetical protein
VNVSLLDGFDWIQAYRICVALYILWQAWGNAQNMSTAMLAVSIILADYTEAGALVLGLVAVLGPQLTKHAEVKEVSSDTEEPGTAQGAYDWFHTGLCGIFQIDPSEFSFPVPLETLKSIGKSTVPVIALMKFCVLVVKWLTTFYKWTRNKVRSVLGLAPCFDGLGDADLANALADTYNECMMAVAMRTTDPIAKYAALHSCITSLNMLAKCCAPLGWEVKSKIADWRVRVNKSLEELRALEAESRPECQHYCFVGPPGVGKSTFITRVLIPLICVCYYF